MEDLNLTVAGGPIEGPIEVNPSSEKAKESQKSPYAFIPKDPVMEAPEGILYDFNDGIRIKFPEGDGKWHLVFMDLDTGTVLHDSDVKGGTYICSVKKYYIKFKLSIYHIGEARPFFEHTLDLKDKEVLIQYPDGAVGDTIGWFSYMERFKEKHQCRLTCIVPEFAVSMFQKQYPDIKLVPHNNPGELHPYATYYMGLFFKCNTSHQPIDFRQVGLHRTAAYILGVDPSDIPPRVDLSAERKIKEKYCVISTQASSASKHWNNPSGWDSVIKFLRDEGYKVYCINRDRNYGDGEHWYHIPWGVEDVTGMVPWQERINLIKDADFYIGLSSGASWVAWCCGVPVVLISGFTLPFCEYYTPYRVINFNVCTGCWDDRKEDFDHGDFMWCPRHKGTPQALECTKAISAEQVISTIKRIPSFKPAVHTDEEKLEKMKARYNASRFDCTTIETAKNVILTKNAWADTDTRWTVETERLRNILINNWETSLEGPKLILDYGCGIGRLAKPLCEMGHKVVGVDISADMRKLALEYVDNEKFSVCSPEELVEKYKGQFDYALSVWTLQHCLEVEKDIDNIKQALKPGGELFVVNKNFRIVPVFIKDWEDDGKDVWKLLKENFEERKMMKFPEGLGESPNNVQMGFYVKPL